MKENFYHGLLLGILSFKGGWSVRSNRESGNGFSDIMVLIDDSDTGIVIEVKYDEKMIWIQPAGKLCSRSWMFVIRNYLSNRGYGGF